MPRKIPLFFLGLSLLFGLWIGYHVQIPNGMIFWLFAIGTILFVAPFVPSMKKLQRLSRLPIVLVAVLGLWMAQLGTPPPEGTQYVTGKAVRYTASGVRLSDVRWLNEEAGYWERSAQPMIVSVDERNPVFPGQWVGIRGDVHNYGNYQIIRAPFYKEYAASLHLPTAIDRWLFEGAQFSKQMARFLHDTLGESTGAIASMLLLGIGANPQTRAKLHSSGLSHLFVVSGFHMLLLYSSLWVLLGFVIPNHQFRSWVCLGFLSAFVMTIGFTPSALRAWMMIGIWTLFQRFRYPIHPLNSLGFVMVLLLFAEPSYAVDVGFHLSFAATTGIILFLRYEPMVPWFTRMRVLPVLGAVLFTIPLTASQFGTMPLLAVPFSIFLFTPLCLFIITGLFFSSIFFWMGWRSLASVFAYGVKPFADLADGIVSFLSERMGSISVPKETGFIALIGIMILILYLEKRRHFCYNHGKCLP